MTVDIPRVTGSHRSRWSAGAAQTMPTPAASHRLFQTSCLHSKGYEKHPEPLIAKFATAELKIVQSAAQISKASPSGTRRQSC